MRFASSVVVASAVLCLAGPACRRAPQRTAEVVAVPVAKVALDPQDAAWNRAPEHTARLLLQDQVEPRLMEPSTAEVRVRALASAADIAFRLEWTDPSAEDLPGPGRSVDACAIQLPAKVQANVPDPQMGHQAHPVEIVFWRADWQASVNGRGDRLQDYYPGASVDHYPFEAPSVEPGSAAQKDLARAYSPARSLGNIRGGPRESPVEELLAEGPGTLTPAASSSARGKGQRTKDGWSVVLIRSAPQGLAPRQRTQIAFAVWEGSHHETGSRKMRTAWIPLLIEEAK